MSDGLDLPAVDVNLSIGEVREASGMIEVQVGHDNVPHLLKRIAEAGDLPDCGTLRVIDNTEGEPEEPDHAGGIGIIVEAKPGIDEHGTLVGFHEDASPTDLPAREPRRHRRAVENVDCHWDSSLHPELPPFPARHPPYVGQLLARTVRTRTADLIIKPDGGLGLFNGLVELFHAEVDAPNVL